MQWKKWNLSFRLAISNINTVVLDFQIVDGPFTTIINHIVADFEKSGLHRNYW